MAEINFYNPKDIGTITIGVTQDKNLNFKSVDGIFIPNPIIRVNFCDELIKDYVLGAGLTLNGNNVQGEEKTLVYNIKGVDFANFKGSELKVFCSFFVEGDIETTFKISVK